MMMQSTSESKKVVCFDLDDTLYKEQDFCRSAYHEISEYIAQLTAVQSDKIYNILSSALAQNYPPFQLLNETLKINLPIQDYLRIYRNHRPSLKLSERTEYTLKSLKTSSCILGLITDGRRITQRNKIEALGLLRFFDDENIIISEEFGSEKPSELNYRYYMLKYPEKEYYYIGDNIEKDFFAPNKLGWTSICLLDDGRNIHSQDFSFQQEFLPSKVIMNIDDILRDVL